MPVPVVRWDPFRDFGLTTASTWTPPVDIFQDGDAELVLKADLPDVDREGIEITIENFVLTIKGEKQMEKEEKEERYYRVERSYGAFTRSVRLPVAVDGSRVSAAFKNGLLTVTLPKTPAAKGTTIPIKME